MIEQKESMVAWLEEKLEMTDMDTGMEGKKIEFCHQIIKGKVYTHRAGN